MLELSDGENDARKEDGHVSQDETIQAAASGGGVRGDPEAGEARGAVGARG